MQATMLTPSRHAMLTALNVRWLRQALTLLDRLDDASYATAPSTLATHRAGAHMRHILEFYQCFLDGLVSSHIDYDARRRNGALERSREAAADAIRSIIHTLESSPELRGERIVWVRVEDAGAHSIRECFMESSVSRELQMLSSHTIHHFALIAVALRLHGVELDAEFGVAPSTLRYLASRAGEAA
jgi:hypothetical protein